ncbi:MAG: ABC transporter ATP-binding protein [Myxococcales bacterium]
MPAIETFNLGKSFAGRRACWDVSFAVERGEVFGLLGPNGAGKTTTLRMLAGLIAPDEGEARVAGERIGAGRAGSARLRARVGLLTESPGFYDRLTAAENLRYFGRLHGLTAHEADGRATRLLGRFALDGHAHRPFAELSRGMKQKLAIARALLHGPEVIFLDEPTVGLDPEATREVRSTVAQLASEHATLVLCTHHLDEVERLCSRAAFVAGRLVAVHAVRAVEGEERVRIALSEPASAEQLARVRTLPPVLSAAAEGATLTLVLAPRRDGVPSAVAALVAAGARIEAVVPVRHALEEAYVALLARARAEGLAA